jgi:hypothetical protein
MGRKQHGFSLSPDILKKVLKEYNHYGFPSASWMVEDCIVYSWLHNPKFRKKLSKTEREHLKTYKEVGEIADSVKPLVFIGQASDIYDREERRYAKNVARGLMSKPSMQKNLDRLAKRLKASISKIDRDQDKKEVEERKKRKKEFLKKHGYQVSNHGRKKS